MPNGGWATCTRCRWHGVRGKGEHCFLREIAVRQEPLDVIWCRNHKRPDHSRGEDYGRGELMEKKEPIDGPPHTEVVFVNRDGGGQYLLLPITRRVRPRVLDRDGTLAVELHDERTPLLIPPQNGSPDLETYRRWLVGQGEWDVRE